MFRSVLHRNQVTTASATPSHMYATTLHCVETNVRPRWQRIKAGPTEHSLALRAASVDSVALAVHGVGHDEARE